MKIETEALITAAQDQALCTNTNVLHCSDDPLCRLCHSFDETVSYVTEFGKTNQRSHFVFQEIPF